ncbi:MAG TPA: type II secretion system protein GspJ [Gammaproteobacteria bacterium]|nr:type II secretion system protein GspJ [Gammaproteobacteria bacterium]
MWRRQTRAGFTLVELLVAMAIFALFATMAYGGLSTVMQTRARTDAVSAQLTALQMAVMFIERDTGQIVPRPVRGQYGSEVPALFTFSGDEQVLEFTRTGYANPAGRQRSHLQRVAWAFADHKLYRLSWPVLDRAPDSEPVREVLLDGVESVSWRFLDRSNRWHNQWPPLNVDPKFAGELPRAVEWTLTVDGWGRIVRLVEVVQPS